MYQCSDFVGKAWSKYAIYLLLIEAYNWRRRNQHTPRCPPYSITAAVKVFCVHYLWECWQVKAHKQGTQSLKKQNPYEDAILHHSIYHTIPPPLCVCVCACCLFLYSNRLSRTNYREPNWVVYSRTWSVWTRPPPPLSERQSVPMTILGNVSAVNTTCFFTFPQVSGISQKKTKKPNTGANHPRNRGI